MEKTQQDLATTIETKAIEPLPRNAQASLDAPIEFSLDDLSFNEGQIDPADASKIQKTKADQQLVEDLNSIPDKMAFKIGEAAELLGVKQYVLRYWETEFEALRPKKSKNNQRVYTRRDVETAMLIKKLLYSDRFSIEGARAALRQLKTQVKDERNWHAVAQGQGVVANQVRELLADIRRLRESFA
jgi:DNA-binding transcriptional MerR regulator